MTKAQRTSAQNIERRIFERLPDSVQKVLLENSKHVQKYEGDGRWVDMHYLLSKVGIYRIDPEVPITLDEPEYEYFGVSEIRGFHRTVLDGVDWLLTSMLCHARFAGIEYENDSGGLTWSYIIDPRLGTPRQVRLYAAPKEV